MAGEHCFIVASEIMPFPSCWREFSLKGRLHTLRSTESATCSVGVADFLVNVLPPRCRNVQRMDGSWLGGCIHPFRLHVSRTKARLTPNLCEIQCRWELPIAKNGKPETPIWVVKQRIDPYRMNWSPTAELSQDWNERQSAAPLMPSIFAFVGIKPIWSWG